MSHITEVVVGGPVAPWARLGLASSAGVAVIGAVTLRVDPGQVSGVRSIGLVDFHGADLDGAPVHVALPPAAGPAASHPLAVQAIDHVVLMTPDLERTCAAVTVATGAPLKRVREAGVVRQGFFRMGEVILEVVQSPRVPAGPATWWGFVVNVADLADACDVLGPEVIGAPRAAVQPGRFIATVRHDVGHGVPLALMSA